MLFTWIYWDDDDGDGDDDDINEKQNYQDIAQKNRAKEEVAHRTNRHYRLNFSIIVNFD